MQKNNRIQLNINIVIFVIIICLVIILNTFFVINQTEQAVIFQFGNPIAVINTAGLKAKLPFIHNFKKFDVRLQELNTEDKEVIASDQKRVIINAFVKYKITDPTLYYTTVKDEYNFNNKFSTILDSSLRQVIGEVPLNNLLSSKRIDIMNKIQEVVDLKAKQFGVNIIDVRITRSDLPQANNEAIFKRMQTDREREAREIRAEGDEIAQKIRANVDKEKTVLLADANKKANIIMGEGDEQANKIYSLAYKKSPEFFEFYRSMQAYKKALKDADKTNLILSPDNEFFKKMK